MRARGGLKVAVRPAVMVGDEWERAEGHPDESSPALSFIYTNVLLSRQFRKCHINKRLNLSTQSVTTDYISLTNQTACLFLRLLMTFFNV